MKFKFALTLAAASIAFGAVTTSNAQTKWDLPAGYAATNFHSVNLQDFANDTMPMFFLICSAVAIINLFPCIVIWLPQQAAR